MPFCAGLYNLAAHVVSLLNLLYNGSLFLTVPKWEIENNYKITQMNAKGGKFVCLKLILYKLPPLTIICAD